MSQSSRRSPTGAQSATKAQIPQRIRFFPTPPEVCSYLPNRLSTNIVADPHVPMDTPLYSQLADHGFRRSGSHLYRPHCGTCQACVPVRIPVAKFQPNRSQTRCERTNLDLTVREQPPFFRREYFELFTHYQSQRHAGGGMDLPNPDGFMRFLTSPWSTTRFVEMRLGPELVAVAVVDYLERGLSAVYTFFATDHSRRSVGTYAVLWQIRRAQALDLPYVYLGYWIKACAKMRYKQNFRPLECLRGWHWVPFDDDGDSPHPDRPSGIQSHPGKSRRIG